jgi:hypothetical protein
MRHQLRHFTPYLIPSGSKTITVASGLLYCPTINNTATLFKTMNLKSSDKVRHLAFRKDERYAPCEI